MAVLLKCCSAGLVTGKKRFCLLQIAHILFAKAPLAKAIQEAGLRISLVPLE